MVKDWTEALVQVLIDRGRASLPGIGTFVLEDSPAVVDQIGKKIQPPASRILLNDNLVLDDGQLVQYLRDHHQLSAEEARTSVESYASDILNRLNNGEQISLTGLGLLRKNFEGKLQFTPASKNLAKTHYGLPEVEVETLVRKQSTLSSSTAAATPAAKPGVLRPVSNTPTQAPPSSSTSAGTQEKRKQLIIWLAGLTLLLVTAGFLIQRLSSNSEPIQPEPISTEEPTPATRSDQNDDAFTRLPSDGTSSQGDASRDNGYEPDPATVNSAEQDEERIQPATRAPEPTPVSGREAVIAIGQFGQATNVDRAASRVTNAGYELYTRQVGGLTRVGARVTYNSETELDQLLQQVRQRLGVSDAFVLIKDGRNLLYD
ncbi:MAG: hypothetical protein AAFY91_02000 [Bacteroidota bacterium]